MDQESLGVQKFGSPTCDLWLVLHQPQYLGHGGVGGQRFARDLVEAFATYGLLQLLHLRVAALVEPEDRVPQRLALLVDGDKALTLVGDTYRFDISRVDLAEQLRECRACAAPPLFSVLFIPVGRGLQQRVVGSALCRRAAAAVPGDSFARRRAAVNADYECFVHPCCV